MITKCNCSDPQLGIMDGDTQTMHCGNCEAPLGGFGGVTLHKNDLSVEQAVNAFNEALEGLLKVVDHEIAEANKVIKSAEELLK